MNVAFQKAPIWSIQANLTARGRIELNGGGSAKARRLETEVEAPDARV